MMSLPFAQEQARDGLAPRAPVATGRAVEGLVNAQTQGLSSHIYIPFAHRREKGGGGGPS